MPKKKTNSPTQSAKKAKTKPPKFVGKTVPCLQCEQKFKQKYPNNWICIKCRGKQKVVEWSAWGGEILYNDNE